MTDSNPYLPGNLSGLFGPQLIHPRPRPRVAQTRTPSTPPSFRLVPNSDTFDIPIAADGRGLVVSNPMRAGPEGLYIENSELDATELRRALLYWDAMVWPRNDGMLIGGGDDLSFLVDAGVMFRPEFELEPKEFHSGLAAEYVVKSYLNSLEELERRSPGQWALSSGQHSIMTREEAFKEGRGMLVELTRAIPLPKRDVPFAEILEFKQRRRDELLELRFVLENMYQGWVNSEDQAHQFKLAMNRVDAAANKVIRVAHDSPMAFSLSSWKINFSVPVSSLQGILAFTMSQAVGLDLVTSTLAGLGQGALSTVSFSRSLGHASMGVDLQAFNYVAALHRENL